MFDLKGTAVFTCMYKAATYISIFYLGWLWGNKCKENFKRKFFQ